MLNLYHAEQHPNLFFGGGTLISTAIISLNLDWFCSYFDTLRARHLPSFPIEVLWAMWLPNMAVMWSDRELFKTLEKKELQDNSTQIVLCRIKLPACTYIMATYLSLFRWIGSSFQKIVMEQVRGTSRKLISENHPFLRSFAGVKLNSRVMWIKPVL